MKKLSIILLISISLVLTSCFKKEEEVKVDETPKTVISNTASPIESITWTIETEKSWNWLIDSWTSTAQKVKTVKKTEVTNIDLWTWSENKSVLLSWSTVDNSWSIIVEDDDKIKLIDASISEETELLSAEEKEFMKNEVDEVDTETFVRFKNSIYSKDKNNVYFLIYWLNKLTWANPNNFKILQPDWYYWTDWTWIYMLEKKIDDMDLDSLKFIKITDKFIVWWDKNNLYIWSRLIIKWWDINSLVYLSENCLKDNKNVYCSFADFWVTKEWDSYEILEWVDLDSYEAYDYFYAKDKDNIYFEWIKLDWIDKTSFKVYKNSLFAKDNTNVYYEWSKLEWIIDVKSFIAINWIPQDENCFYKINQVENLATCETE